MTAEEEREESRGSMRRFDIVWLSQRLAFVIDWLLKERAEVRGMRIGTFGASTGGAAAIEVAVLRDDVKAVVSRGGRPDLANPELLQRLTAPTLLLVGGEDREVLMLNQRALSLMRSCQQKKLVVVPGATHLFEEEGTLEKVAETAKDWFVQWLKEGEAANKSEGNDTAEAKR